MARTIEAIAEHGGRGAAERGRGGRGGRYRRAAGRRATAPPSSTRCARDAASTSRSSPARRKPGSRTSPRLPASSVGDGLARRVRDRWRQLAVHLRASRPCRRALQRRRRSGAVHRAVRPRTASSTTACSAPRSARSPPTWCALDGRPTPDALVAMGGAVTNLAAVKHELATYDPEVVQGSGARPAQRSTGRSSSTGPATLEERRQIVGLQPKRAEVILAGACIVRTVLDEARQRLAHRERPGSAPRLARRALRLVTEARALARVDATS